MFQFVESRSTISNYKKKQNNKCASEFFTQIDLFFQLDSLCLNCRRTTISIFFFIFFSNGLSKAWFGINDIIVEGHWVWLDETPLNSNESAWITGTFMVHIPRL